MRPFRRCKLIPILTLSGLFGLIRADDVVLCGQYDTYNTSQYTFRTDIWGDDGSGAQCITISSGDTVFSATWAFRDNANAVHSFPDINLNSANLPLKISRLAQLDIAAHWSMVPSDPSASLSDVEAIANVVVDMFLDPDPSQAGSTTAPQYEVMIWLGAFGGRKPIGFDASASGLPVYQIGNTSFTLYSGPNGNGQYTYSWLASHNVSNFRQDFSPLIRHLWQNESVSSSNYLGLVQFGSETIHATSNVTFTTRDFSMSLTSGQPAYTVSCLILLTVMTAIVAI